MLIIIYKQKHLICSQSWAAADFILECQKNIYHVII